MHRIASHLLYFDWCLLGKSYLERLGLPEKQRACPKTDGSKIDHPVTILIHFDGLNLAVQWVITPVGL